jgi:hypothetical protein
MAWRSGQPESYQREPRHQRRGYPERQGGPAERQYRADGYRQVSYRQAGYREPRYQPAPGKHPDVTGGAEGNARLTAAAGAVLLVLFAAEGVTILAVRQLLTLHYFFGMLLIGPVLLKICSTGYRFVRYYAGAAEYRRKGPPAPLLRLLGPFVIVLSVAVIGTGVMLGYAGRNIGPWLFLHKATFVLWFGAMTIHVLAYAWRLPRMLDGDFASRAGYQAQAVLAGRRARWLLLTASLLAGLLLAVLTFGQAGIWLAAHSVFGGG